VSSNDTFPTPEKGPRVAVLTPLLDRITFLCAHGGLTGIPKVNLPGATVDGTPRGPVDPSRVCPTICR
jgi:amidase